jgi:flagellar assembly factor FliW
MTTLAPTLPTEQIPRVMSLRFVRGMPGLEEYTNFTLVALDDSPAYFLRCDDEPAIALPVVDAFAIAPEYSFDLPASDVRALALYHAADALVLAVLTMPRGPGTVTANLFAPVVINRATGRAKLVILDGTRHGLRHPVAEIR